ncbi:MAG: 16S rRNA (cytosine(1402)-N(4))-methyltransferase RsmH [Armatimonadetes bacterium]|nr:16S rRNA (cytosine(1402)-N(4))-methyltransferase RsmH [Armatimonadota bacterium]
MSQFHRPVMLSEVLDLLDPKPGGVYVDCTLGGGGHAKGILDRILPGGKLIGIDRDQDAIAHATAELVDLAENITLVRGDFSELDGILRDVGVESVVGVLFDLGVSSYQLETPERGFSFQYPAPLDMRMDRSQPVTAADLVNTLTERELADLIYTHSDERWSRRIARVIVGRRALSPITTTSELAEIVASAIPARAHPPRIHPATRTFQALRVAVNAEFEALDRGLAAAAEALAAGGRMCVISYHSLEDRRVKQFFSLASGRCMCPPELPQCVCGARRFLRILTKKPVTPAPEEIAANPRSRSAKLRAAEKL